MRRQLLRQAQAQQALLLLRWCTIFFLKRRLSKLFFCFADPHFKAKNHRRRIINRLRILKSTLYSHFIILFFSFYFLIHTSRPRATGGASSIGFTFLHVLFMSLYYFIIIIILNSTLSGDFVINIINKSTLYSDFIIIIILIFALWSTLKGFKKVCQEAAERVRTPYSDFLFFS